jgi:hypothetical protein
LEASALGGVRKRKSIVFVVFFKKVRVLSDYSPLFGPRVVSTYRKHPTKIPVVLPLLNFTNGTNQASGQGGNLIQGHIANYFKAEIGAYLSLNLFQTVLCLFQPKLPTSKPLEEFTTIL